MKRKTLKKKEGGQLSGTTETKNISTQQQQQPPEQSPEPQNVWMRQMPASTYTDLEARKAKAKKAADLQSKKAELEARKAKAKKENEDLAAILQKTREQNAAWAADQDKRFAESKTQLENSKPEIAENRNFIEANKINVEQAGTRIAEIQAKKKDNEELKDLVLKIGHDGNEPTTDLSEEELTVLQKRMQELKQKLGILYAEEAQGDETKSLESLGGKSRKYKKNSKRNTRKGKNRKTPRKQGLNRSKKRKN